MLFNDFKDKYLQYKNKLISFEDWDNWFFENVNVKKYIPLVEKTVMLHDIDAAFEDEIRRISSLDSKNLEAIFILYDMTKLFDILFRYTDIEIEKSKRNIENYDFVMSNELDVYLREKIGRDFDTFSSLFEKSSGINEINMIKVISGYLEDYIKTEDIDKLQNMFKNLTPARMKQINKFLELNNPMIADIVENIKKNALDDMNKK